MEHTVKIGRFAIKLRKKELLVRGFVVSRTVSLTLKLTDDKLTFKSLQCCQIVN